MDEPIPNQTIIKNQLSKMYINKTKSIRKGFFFSSKKFPVALTLSSGLLVQLIGCNAHQGKDGFIAIPKAEALGKVSGISYKEINNYQSCCDATPGQSVINDINHIGNMLYKQAYKLDVNSSGNKKADIHKETEGLLERIKVALHAKLKEQAKLIEQQNKLILEEQTKLTSFFRNLYEGITLIIQNRELDNNKTQKTKNEYEKILIDNLYKVCQDDDNFYQAFQICMHSKSMKNNNDKKKLLYNIYQILYKKVYGDNAGSNINKGLESLLTDIQCLTQIGLHNLPKSNSLIERKNKINGFLEYSKQLLDYPIDKQDYFSWVLSRNDVYDTLMMTNVSNEPKRNRKGKLFNKIRCILGKKHKKFDPRSAIPVDKRSDKFAFSNTEYGTDSGNIPPYRKSDEPSSSNTEYDSGYDTDSEETFF